MGTEEVPPRLPAPRPNPVRESHQQPRTSSSGILILVAAKTQALGAALWRGVSGFSRPAGEPEFGAGPTVRADWINPLGPEPAPSNLFECGPRSLRAALGPALGLGRRRRGMWRSRAPAGCGWSTRPLAGRTMHRGLFAGARAASQHLDSFLFLVLKVVPSPPSHQFCKVCMFLGCPLGRSVCLPWGTAGKFIHSL